MIISIRPLKIEDTSISYKWRNDPEVWKYTGSRPTITITEEIERKWFINSISDQTKLRFAILVDDLYVGNVQLTNISHDKTAEFHIFIGDKFFWGKGVAKEATFQILNYAKNILDLKSIFLEVRKENLAAIKSYKNNNFEIINETSEFLRMVCEFKTV